MGFAALNPSYESQPCVSRMNDVSSARGAPRNRTGIELFLSCQPQFLTRSSCRDACSLYSSVPTRAPRAPDRMGRMSVMIRDYLAAIGAIACLLVLPAVAHTPDQP